jgi:hypothetical protein
MHQSCRLLRRRAPAAAGSPPSSCRASSSCLTEGLHRDSGGAGRAGRPAASAPGRRCWGGRLGAAAAPAAAGLDWGLCSIDLSLKQDQAEGSLCGRARDKERAGRGGGGGGSGRLVVGRVVGGWVGGRMKMHACSSQAFRMMMQDADTQWATWPPTAPGWRPPSALTMPSPATPSAAAAAAFSVASGFMAGNSSTCGRSS